MCRGLSQRFRTSLAIDLKNVVVGFWPIVLKKSLFEKLAQSTKSIFN